jgi:hypothetical protein
MKIHREQSLTFKDIPVNTAFICKSMTVGYAIKTGDHSYRYLKEDYLVKDEDINMEIKDKSAFQAGMNSLFSSMRINLSK